MPAFVYRNESEQLANHYLKIKFQGYAANPFGIGTRVKITTGSGIQTLQNFNTRGFESSVEPHLLFGVGSAETIDSLEVIWPDKTKQVLTDIRANHTLTLHHFDAREMVVADLIPTPLPTPLFVEVSDRRVQGESQHHENPYNDFDHEILLWRMLSTEGPRMVVGDVNNDAREDFVVLGAHDDEDKLFMQTKEGTFQRKSSAAFQATRSYESSCGAFLDLDQDGDEDLILGAGGNEYQRGGENFTLRYYENDGQGNFRLDNDRVPPVVGNFSCIETGDVDGDGDTDLFLGGRCAPGNYGLPPRSFLLLNEPDGWKDVAPESLAGIGMVTDAAWADVDDDQDQDLVVVGDWMGVHIFRNEGGILTDARPLPNSNGWWTRVEAADLDQDGDTDFVLGNWGLNSKFKASPR